MRFDETYSGKVFIKSHPNYEESKAVLYGMPMDWTVSYRPGSRFGPNKIREVSIGLEEYSPYLDRELGDVLFFDAGDIPLPFGNPEKSLTEIETYVHTLLADEKIPMGMGGEHLVSLPVMKAVASKYDDLAIIHFDAHTDLRENYEGEEYSHSTPIRKIADHIGPENVYSFGIRSGMKEEFDWAKENGMHISKFEVLEPLKEVLPTLEGRNVYVTIDMDVLDPAHAPGTGTVDAGGITSRELLASIHAIAASGVNVVGFDLVELAPVYDHSDQTANTASKLMREMILGWIK
ncbi:agmatinase [Planococcus sp. PAMC 21323]|uniref:agmatinase n=1 Tax=Planococcus sp. PAMC 21323 TaxID=1526927 RepID=UPI00056E3F86|nr:agmatinase [Planococcus sp. PAMC 21323]AIY06411.1 agmatinase [Planococcus sp. PAMC 21323]